MIASQLLLLLAASPVFTKMVPAAGRQVADVEISAFGRYGITVESKQGVALQLVDKVAGPGAIHGRPGAEDGRIDAFLDRGTYRVITHGDPKSEGDAKITVRPYRELSGQAPAALVEHKPIDLVLGDFEQRSYWLDLPHRRTVALEAAGRNLSELRLWKDGTWLVDAEAVRDLTEPKVGRPLTVLRMSADLESGLYLVTAYGGRANAWADENGRHPFHLRYGIPPLPSALRKRFTVGPFGYDRYLVSGATFFRIETPEAKLLALDLRVWSEAQPFAPYSARRVEITKKSVPPVGEVDAGAGPWLVTISGEEGDPYLLQHFRSSWYTRLPDGGRHWVSTVHAGHAEDSLDATAVLVGPAHPYPPLDWKTVTLEKDRPWSRRFNLLDQATVFIDVREAGSYRIIGGGGAEATFQLQPFLITRPNGHVEPPFRGSGSEWKVSRGLYVLTIAPQKKGVLDVTVSKTGAFFETFKSLREPRGAAKLPRGQVRFESLATRDGWIYVNHQPGVRTGVIARALPIDLRDPLPITQAPDEQIEIPARFEEEGLLYAEAEDGARLDLSLDGGEWSKSLRPPLGEHRVRVRHSGAGLVAYSLTYAPKRLAADTPLPPLPDGRLAGLPKFPLLQDGKPVYFDLERSSGRTFLVRARSPALFRLESTGLLATEGSLRTRMVTSLVRNRQNGVGRNFLVQQYLGTGDYQITVNTLGRTRGHLGVRLKRTPEQNGGRLKDGIPARATLLAGHTIVYPFEIGEAGRYRLRAIGRDRTLRCRLEDAEGWPMVQPNVAADFDRHFDPGKYRLVILPESVDVRVVALLEKIDPAPTFAGHGPHRIRLDQPIAHVWTESAPGPTSKPEARQRDVWLFDVPAPIEASIVLSDQMHGDLIRIGSRGLREKVAYVPPLRGWSGTLARGEHRLEVLNLHETSDLPYTVQVHSGPLVVGLERSVGAPSTIPISIGERGLVEISSFGSPDVSARLIDAEGRTVAKNDDRPDDWNFHLAARLDPGRYLLAVSPVGSAYGTTTVAMRSRAEVAQEALRLPVKKRVQVGRKVHVHPLPIAEGARFLAVHAASAETLGLVLEAESDGVFRAIATSVGRPARIELPLAPGASKRKHRLKLWSADERDAPIELIAVAIDPQRIDERALAQGARIARSAELPIAVAEVSLERSGTFRTRGNLRWSPTPDAAAGAPARQLIHPQGTRVFLVKDAGKERDVELQAERIVLEKGTIDFELGDRPIDLDLAGEGPVLVRADAAKGQPATCILGKDERIRPACFDVREHGAISVHLDATDAVARVWAGRATPDPVDSALEVHRFPAPERQRVAAGSRHGSIPAGVALAFELPAGRKRISVALEDGAAAVLADGTRIERIAWASGDTETFEGGGRRLVLLNPIGREVTFAMEILPLAGEPLSLAGPYERRSVEASRIELPVPAGKEHRRLFVRGGDAVFVDAEGTVHFGAQFLVGAGGGSLRVRHGVGTVMAWIDPPGSPGAGLFAQPHAPADVPIPSAVSLSGAGQALRFQSERPQMIHVRVGAPVVARWERTGQRPELLIREEGGTLHLHLPSGRGSLTLRGIGGGLFGSAEVTATAVEPIGEGVGPEVMIAPGSGRAFAFEVREKGAVGIGVRSDSAEIEALLVDSGGRELGRGVVQMHQLEPGTHLLYVHAPAAARPARARAALVGVEKPPSGPPAEVIQAYLAAAGFREP